MTASTQPSRKAPAPMTTAEKIRALVDEGLAETKAEARAMLEDMGEL